MPFVRETKISRLYNRRNSIFNKINLLEISMTDELKAHFKPAYDFTVIYKFHKIYTTKSCHRQ